MNNYEETYYYTLGDVIKKTSWWTSATASSKAQKMIGVADSTSFLTVLKEVFSDLGASFTETTYASTEVNTLFSKYIVPRFWSEYVLRTDEQVTDDTSISDDIYKELFQDVCSLINDTYTKYKKLLDLYSTEQNNLLNEVANTSFTKFNDTPSGSGDFSGDGYATNVTTITTKSDVETKIKRIAEIDRLFRNLYNDWTDEISYELVYRGV